MGDVVGLSEYELQRLERIKENKKMLEELFPDGTGLYPLQKTSPRERTPEGEGVRRVRKKATPSRRKLMMSARRNPSRKARPSYAQGEFDRPTTRSMTRSVSGSGEGLMNGISDEREVRRVVYRRWTSKRKLAETEALPIELDNKPAFDHRILKNLVARSTDKVYDRVRGTTCHQCRQKTIDPKTCCHNRNCNGVRGQFCGPCLQNRYGEDVRKVLLDNKWVCPPCRGICNCSFCLPKKGHAPTGIMIHTARDAGYHNVRDFLEKSNYLGQN